MPDYIDEYLELRKKPPVPTGLSDRIIERTALMPQKKPVVGVRTFVREFFDALLVPQPVAVFAICLILGFSAGLSLELSNWDIYDDQLSDFLYVEGEI